MFREFEREKKELETDLCFCYYDSTRTMYVQSFLFIHILMHKDTNVHLSFYTLTQSSVVNETDMIAKVANAMKDTLQAYIEVNNIKK